MLKYVSGRNLLSNGYEDLVIFLELLEIVRLGLDSDTFLVLELGVVMKSHITQL